MVTNPAKSGQAVGLTERGWEKVLWINGSHHQMGKRSANHYSRPYLSPVEFERAYNAN